MACLRLISLVFCVAVTVVSCSLVTISNSGGYKNLIVGVSSGFNVTNVESYFKKLENVFREASKSLHLATRRRFYFEEVVFSLPKSFAVAGMNLDVRTTSFTRPDFILSQGDILEPFTLQHDGCGKLGLRVYLPEKFLENSAAHKVLVREWAHYRYGVFDEHGYIKSAKYPLKYRVPGSDHTAPVSVTSCTNVEATYTYTNATGFACGPSSEECLPHLDEMKNPHIISSLMDRQTLTKASEFCDGKTYQHNRSAPSMQNSLCREKSIWDVLAEHKDFKSNSNTNQLLPTTFKYILESVPRIVFVIEATKNLATNNRIDLVRNAFSYFTLFDMPNNGKMWLINLRRMIRPFPFAKFPFEGLLDSYPEAYDETKVCVHCGITEAITVLEDDDNADGFIILVTTVDIQPDKLSEVTKSLIENNVKLFVIFFGDPIETPPLLHTLAEDSNGRMFFIMESNKKSKVMTTLTQLYEVFRSIYEFLTWRSKKKVLVEQRVFHDDITAGSMSFTIDESIDRFQVIITGPDFLSGPPVLKDKLILKHISSTEGIAQFSYKMKVPAYILSVDRSLPGEWELHFQRKRNNDKQIVIMIRASSDESMNAINVKSWITPAQAGDTQPSTMYAEIVQGLYNPMSGVNVTAIVHHHASAKETVFQLLDSGEGNPDIRKNDGIFSRCLTGNLQKGYFTLTVIARKYLNDSMNQKEESPDGVTLAEAFSRITSFGSFYLKDSLPNYAPRRIVDLYVATVQTLQDGVKHYTLRWTAPGDEYDSGLSYKYEIKVFQNRDNALNRFETNHILKISEWETHGPWLTPGTAGTAQKLIIQLDLPQNTYFIAMRAMDDDRNVADVSNIIEIFHSEPNRTTIRPYLTSEYPETEESSSKGSTPEPSLTNDTKAGDSHLPVIIGVTCGLLFFFIIIAIFLLIYLSTKRKRRESKKNTISPPYFPRKHSDTASTICRTLPTEETKNPSANPAYATDIEYVNNLGKTNYHNIPTISRRVQDGVFVISRNNSLISNPIFPPPICNQGSVSEANSFYDVPLFEEDNMQFHPTFTSSLRRMPSQKSACHRLGTDV